MSYAGSGMDCRGAEIRNRRASVGEPFEAGLDDSAFSMDGGPDNPDTVRADELRNPMFQRNLNALGRLRQVHGTHNSVEFIGTP